MRRVLVCTGVLGGGTALVFALAAATAMLFPQGTLVGSGWNGGMMFAKPVPEIGGGPVFLDDVVVMPAVEQPAITIPDAVP
ncbi:MAG TPA: hypothetical protein VES19_12595 [Candidatus Limnocylindrales bacterium]|nr:hypothetical protein [Candidatus Limnocylindrales bacterium]